MKLKFDMIGKNTASFIVPFEGKNLQLFIEYIAERNIDIVSNNVITSMPPTHNVMQIIPASRHEFGYHIFSVTGCTERVAKLIIKYIKSNL